MYYTDTERIRKRVFELADKHLNPYRPKGDEIIPTLCPFCHGGAREDKYTFALNMDTGLYVCKRGGCGERGNLYQLSKYFGEDMNQGGVGMRSVTTKKQAKIYDLPPDDIRPLTPEIIDYFEKRKISQSTLEAFKVGADEHGKIVFPFYDNGRLIYVKYRNPWKPKKGERKEWQYTNTKPILFGMDNCSFSKPLVVTEGQLDALSVYESGYTNVVSVPCGTDNLDWIEHCWEFLEKFREIILFGDNDEPGRKMVTAVSRRLDEARCQIVNHYPMIGVDTPTRSGLDECKDANEILYFCGKDDVLEAISSAQSVPIKGVIDLSTVTPVDPTTIERIKTGIPDLDKKIGGLRKSGLTVFTGKAASGKSTVASLLVLNAIEQGYNVCAYSGELDKEDFQEVIHLQAAGSPYITYRYDNIDGENVPIVPFDIQRRIMEWYKGKLFLYDNSEILEETTEAESVLRVFTSMARRYGCKLFLVDNMMTALADTDEEIRAQAKFMTQLKRFVNYFGVHVIVVAHPRKTKMGERLRQDDVGGNSAIVNLADNAIAVERPNLNILKNRRKGLNVSIDCVYCRDSRRVYQADSGDHYKFSWDKEGAKQANPRADTLPEYGIELGESGGGNGPF